MIFSNHFHRTAISKVESFHPSAQQKQASYMNVELDVEKKLQAKVAKDRVRIKEFFIDFDKLRKGFVGEAAVSYRIKTWCRECWNLPVTVTSFCANSYE